MTLFQNHNITSDLQLLRNFISIVIQTVVYFRCFLCSASLSASLLINVPISKLLRNHGTNIYTSAFNGLVDGLVNSCFIILRQNFFPISFSYDRVQVFHRQTFLSMWFLLKIKENGWTFYFKAR